MDKFLNRYNEWDAHVNVCKLSVEEVAQSALFVKEKVKCPECSKQMTSPQVLENHYRVTHSPPEMIVCQGCSSKFRNVSQILKSHYYFIND